MEIGIREVAKKANVAISTVSRVLNNSGYVSEATKVKVLAATEELGYRQNSIARSLRSKRSHFIGLLVPDIANEFFSSLASVIEQSVHDHGFSLFLCNTMENKEIENRYVESLFDNQVMGIILVSAGMKFNTSVLREDIPVVFLDRIGPGMVIPNRVFIECDNEKGGCLAAEELLKRGARRFVFLGDQRNMHAMRNRKKGFSETLHANGIPASNYYQDTVSVSALKAREKVKEIYASFPFDGIFCGTDLIALGAMRGLADIGLSIPSDVQLIGFDGISSGEFTIPSMSTIRQDIEQMGRIAGESIIRMIKGDHDGKTILLPVDILARGTTK